MARAQHCSGCGAELGLIVESELHDRPCCDCLRPLEIMVEPSGSLLNCRKCGGQFVEHALLRNLLERQERMGLAFADAPYQRPEKASLERVQYRPCPMCQQRMNRKNFGGASGVIVDVCARHGTWLDAGELPQVLAFVRSGGLVRERAREQERLRQARAHEREFSGATPHSSPLAFDSTHCGEPHSFAKDLLEFVIEVLSGSHRPSNPK
ncbi:MAG TPA: zf-TFIIB domain-containing protein [Polyangiaceae bacterium]|nr:zf-TFIIB domain-containing protein [Polyangiaceae bacterium]